jgi:hypothetical protein
MVCAAACAAGVALVWGMGGTVGAQQGARVIQLAELPDMSLGAFHNGLFRSPFEHIVDDHGVRLGSLGSDLFHDPDDSYNEFWAVTDRGPNGNPGRRTFLAPKFNPVILYIRVQDRIQILNALPILDASGLPVTGLSNVEGFDERTISTAPLSLPVTPTGSTPRASCARATGTSGWSTSTARRSFT